MCDFTLARICMYIRNAHCIVKEKAENTLWRWGFLCLAKLILIQFNCCRMFSKPVPQTLKAGDLRSRISRYSRLSLRQKIALSFTLYIAIKKFNKSSEIHNINSCQYVMLCFVNRYAFRRSTPKKMHFTPLFTLCSILNVFFYSKVAQI